QFVALDRPCLDKYRLCSTHCSVSQLRGDFNCQFCVCDDPKYEIAWPTSTTTAIPLTSTTVRRRTDRPGEWTVNNITYSKIHNPCYQIEANCPINCKRHNETKDRDYRARVHIKRSLRKMCMPLFSCPIKRCPSGQTFQLTTFGCPMCQCVPLTYQDTNPHFLSLFCKLEPDGCPADCNVVDYRVGEWHCYHCNCPANSYKALANPCKDDKYLCPTHCTVRDLTDSRDSSIVCQYCDCGGFHREWPYGQGKLEFSLTGFGEKTRPTCSPTTRHIQSAGSSYHKLSITDQHCLPAALSIFCPGQCKTFHVSNCYYCSCNGGFLTVSFIRHVLEGIGPHKTDQHTDNSRTTTTVSTTTPVVYTTMEPSKSTHQPTVPTTTAPSTPVPTTTRRTTAARTNTRGTATVSYSAKPNSCYLCSGLSCSEKDAQVCPSDQDYCMSTINQDEQGERNITRRCVTEDVCYNQWWIVSADSPTCVAMTNDLNGPSGNPEICNFCCKGSLCNKQGRIPDGDLYKGEAHPSASIITIG
ncbi:hypothetical protein FSP39_015302, partial [Pinctada imbricata]